MNTLRKSIGWALGAAVALLLGCAAPAEIAVTLPVDEGAVVQPVADAAAPVTSAVTSSAASAAPTAVSRVATAPAAPRRLGVDTYNAEALAKARGCTALPMANLVSKGPGFEHHSVPCNSGLPLQVRCEFGHCRVI